MDRDEEERVDIARILLSGRTLNSGIDALGTTVLMFAVKHGYYDFVDILLQDQSIDTNTTNSNGHTALWFAVDSQPAPLVPLKTDLPDGILGLLLHKGADPNIQCQKSGRSILAHAISSQRSAAIAALLKCDRLELSKGVLPDISDAQEKLGLTPLPYADQSKVQLATEGRSLSSSLHANNSINLSAGDTLEDILPELEIRTMKAACNRKRRLSGIEEDEMRGDKQIKVQ
jgi:ankyrin repeat protein